MPPDELSAKAPRILIGEPVKQLLLLRFRSYLDLEPEKKIRFRATTKMTMTNDTSPFFRACAALA